MRRPSTLEVRLDILEEHIEDLGFLWIQRDGVLDAEDWSLADLSSLEARADAHRDAALLSSPHAARLALEQLRSGDAATACGCALVLLDAAEPAPVLAALQDADPPVREGVRLALRDSGIDALVTELESLARSSDWDCAWRAADALAFHHRPVPVPSAWFDSEAPEVRASAWALMALAREPLDGARLKLALEDPAESVRWKALTAALVRSSRPDASLARAACKWPRTPMTLRALSILGGAPAWELVAGLAAGSGDESAAALVSLAGFGRVEAVPILLPHLDSELAPTARTAMERLLAPPKESMLSRAQAERWWDSARSRFDAARTWQLGIPVDVTPAAQWLSRLPLAWRRDAWLGAMAAGRPVPKVDLDGRASGPRGQPVPAR